MLEQGSIIDGRYEVESMIGEGGLAQVYKVRHKALGSVHALKLLSWRKKQLAERLLTEGRIQAQLQHPNIVSVIDLVQHEGQFGLLMEFVDNQCLEDFIIQNGGMGVLGGMELFAPILSAVAAAHDAGVTHRDLKPANVLLAARPGGVIPKVTDFGIAKVMAELTGTSTAAGSTMGTPGYLAPEQIEDSSNVDKRADIFALGAILYELITGRQAFIEDDGTIGVMSTSRVDPPPLTTWIDDVPEHLDAVLAKAMAKQPADRYVTCIEFAEALFVDHPKLQATVVSAGAVTTTLSLSGAREELERTLERNTLNRGNTAQPAPQAATIVAEPPPEPSGGSGRIWLGLGLLAIGAVLLTVALAGAGAFGVKRTMVTLEEPTEDPMPVLPTEPDPVPQPTPVVSDPIQPTIEDPAEPAPVEPAPEPAPTQPAPVERTPDPSPTPDRVDPTPAPQPVDPAPAEPAPAEPTAVEPAPVAPVAPDPVAVAPAPVPEPAPVEPTPVPKPPDLAGSWTGKAHRRPFRLTLSQGAGGALTGRVVFPGATTREESLQGTVDTAGKVRFEAGDLSFTGTATGGRLQGTYTSGGGKALEWSVDQN